MLRSPVRNPPGKPPDQVDAPLMLGVEQEFELFAGGKQLDFGVLFPQVVEGTRSFPFRNSDGAVILDSGYMLACDGREAELATVPVNYQGGGCLTLAREVSRCREHLIGLLNSLDVRDVRGYSTHLNISVPIGREREIASAISTTAAPSLILLMEGRQSPGMLLRPRRGRLEIGSEYIDDEKQLAVAAVFLAGVVSAYLGNGSLWNQFPHIRLKRSEEGNIRPGIYLPHDAYGESIHDLGRAAMLELESGESIRAGDVLAWCTDLVLRELNGQISERAGTMLSDITQQLGSLQIERQANPNVIARCASHLPAPEARTLKMLASAPDLFGVTPRFIDWTGVAFSWEKEETPLIIGIPWTHLLQFFHAALLNDLALIIRKPKFVQPVLNSLDQLQSPQVFRAVDPVALGTQALNDKGKNGGKKGGSPKPPVQHERVVEFPPTIIARRPSRPPQVGKRNRGLIIGILIVLISILIVTIGMGILNFRSLQAAPTTVQTSTPTVVTTRAIPQINFTPTLVCVSAPGLSAPAEGAIFTTMSIPLRWTYDFALEPGQVFVVLVSLNLNDLQDSNVQNLIVGTTTDSTLLINFLQTRYSGALGTYYWLVRVRGADGRFVDCPGSPGSFVLTVVQPPTKKPKGEPAPTAVPTSGGKP